MRELLTAAQWRTLTTLCDALAPALDAGSGLQRRAASAVGVPQAMLETLAGTGNPADLADFHRLLDTFGGRTGAVLAGQWRPLHQRDAAGREALLRAWADSSVADLRKGFQVLKRLTGFFFLANLDLAGHNPNWDELGYRSPPERPELAPPVVVSSLNGAAEWTADAVVIGSGAGGGVAAWELTARGLQVVVLEAGEAVAEAEMGGPEVQGMQRMYLDRGLAANTDASLSILAGACLGGGTTVNWTACLPPPEWLLDEWERQRGVTGIGGKGFRNALAGVLQRLQAGPGYSESAPASSAGRLLAGCRTLGYSATTCWRNVQGCGENCGDCCFGCPYGAKQSTLRTYLRDANQKGCRIYCNAHVDRVTTQAGRVTGVVASVRTQGGGMAQVTVRAPLVMLAAGALNTPAVLLRSGINNPHVGAHLHLHPVTGVTGRYAETVAPWRGRLLPAYCDQFAHLDGHYGFLLEVAPVHPGLAALAVPWRSGKQYKQQLTQLAHTGNFITLVRDKGEGRVSVDRAGRRRIAYRLAAYDAAHLRQGMVEAVKVHAAAGAESISTLHADPLAAEAPPGGRLRSEQVAAMAEAILSKPIAPNRIGLYSAHQMGTARLGPSPEQAVAGPDGQVFGVAGLYVADAAAFPAAAGVNPMVTVMALASWIARGAQPTH